MDEVFGKYCKKWPEIYGCLDNVTATARSCMDNKEEAAFNKSLQILSELQEFMCFKDGDRMASKYITYYCFFFVTELENSAWSNLYVFQCLWLREEWIV